MYLAKESGKNNYQFYNEEIKNKSFEKISLEKYLRNALEKNDVERRFFEVYNFSR